MGLKDIGRDVHEFRAIFQAESETELLQLPWPSCTVKL